MESPSSLLLLLNRDPVTTLPLRLISLSRFGSYSVSLLENPKENQLKKPGEAGLEE